VIALIVVLIDMIYFIIYKLKGPPEIDFDSLSEQVSYFIQGTIETQTTQIQSTLQKQHDKSLLALQQEYNSLSSSLQNEVRLHQIVYGMHIILNESLNHFELNVSPIILEKYFIDEDLVELSKDLTKNITIIEEKFFTHLENELDIPSIILQVLYRVQQGQAVSYEDILSSPDLMKKYSDIILNHELMKGLNCTDVMLNEIIGIEKTLDFSKLLEGVKYLTKVLRITRELISKLEEYKIKLEYQIYLKLILTNKNDLLARESNNLDLNLYIIEKIIQNLTIFQIDEFQDILPSISNLIAFCIFYYEFREYYLDFCKSRSEDLTFLKLLWMIFTEDADIKQSLRKNLDNPTFYHTTLQNFDSNQENEKFIKIFKVEFEIGELIISKRELYQRYAHRVESKLGMTEYLFKSYGEIDYRALYLFVFNLCISQNSLLRILSSQNAVKPFLLTFGSGAGSYIENFVEKDKKKYGITVKKYFAPQYTPSARIGILPDNIHSLKELRKEFLKDFRQFYFNTSNEKFAPFFAQLDEIIKYNSDRTFSEALKHLKEDLIHHLNENKVEIPDSIINNLKKILKNNLPVYEQAIVDAIDELNPDFDIIFHDLSPDEEGFQIIAYGNKSETIKIIKDLFAKKSGNRTLSAGLIFDELELEKNATTLNKILTGFMKSSSFSNLFCPNAHPVFKTFDELNSRPKNNQIISILFGEEATSDFCAKYRLTSNDFDALGSFLKYSLKIEHVWSPELYEKNKAALDEMLGKYATDLNEFWEELLNSYQSRFAESALDIKKKDIPDFELIAENLPIFATVALKIIIYMAIVVKADLESYDLHDASEDILSLQKEITGHLDSRLFSNAKENPYFERILALLIAFGRMFQNSPMSMDYIKKDFARLEETELEVIFKNRFNNFIGYRVPEGDFSREAKMGADDMDFKLFGHPVECKIRKESDLELTEFLQYHLKQISGYCAKFSNRNNRVGVFLYYDNVLQMEQETFQPGNIRLESGIVQRDINDEVFTPVIIIVRIPSFGLAASGQPRIKKSKSGSRE